MAGCTAPAAAVAHFLPLVLYPRSNGMWLGYHDSGYTSFAFYLHNLTDPLTGRPALIYGPGAPNILAVRVDALTAHEGACHGMTSVHCSPFLNLPRHCPITRAGWFYAGGGINRNVRLVAAGNVSVVHWGVYAPATITGNISSPSGGNAGPQTASSAVVLAQARQAGRGWG